MSMHNFCNEMGSKVQCFRKWKSKTKNRAGLQTTLLKKKKKLNRTQWAWSNRSRKKIFFLKVLNDLASVHVSSLISIFFSAHIIPSNFVYLSLLQQHWLPLSPLNMPSSFLSQDPPTSCSSFSEMFFLWGLCMVGSFKSQPKCHLLREAFPNHLI